MCEAPIPITPKEATAMMYQEHDYTNAKNTMSRYLVLTGCVLMAFIAAMLVGVWLRIKPLAVASPVVGSWVFYTMWVVLCLPWVRYYKFLCEMKNGRRRITECYYMDVAGRVRIVDGVQIHDMNASLDPEGEDPRLFYWDDDKPLPTYDKGQKVRITSYGNFVTGIEAI